MFEDQYNNKLFADYKIVSEDNIVYAHRVILQTIPYFRKLLTENHQYAPRGLSCSKDNFYLVTEIIYFTYTGKDFKRGYTFEEWLEILLIAELWEHEMYVSLHLPILISMINEENLEILMKSTYSKLLPIFFTETTFQNIIPSVMRVSNNLVRSLVVTHEFCPFVIALKSFDESLIIKWTSTHFLTSCDLVDQGSIFAVGQG